MEGKFATDISNAGGQFAIGNRNTHGESATIFRPRTVCPQDKSSDVPSIGQCRPLDDASLGQRVPGQCVLILWDSQSELAHHNKRFDAAQGKETLVREALFKRNIV